MRRFRTLLASALALGAGCSGNDATSPSTPAVDHDAEGSWGPKTLTLIPGSSFLITMNESAGAITGGGSFAGEAGPFGSLAVTGTVAHDSLHLRIIYIFEPTVFPKLAPDTAQFTGALTNKDQIDGQLTRRGVSSSLELVRLKVGDSP